MPLYVVFGEQSYKDGVEITPDKLFELVQERNMLPRTAGITPYDYINYFGKYVEEDYDLVVILISSEFSSTYQNAVLAASEFPPGRIKVVDSRNLSTGIGFLVLTASQMAQAGVGSEEIVAKLNAIIPKMRVEFVLDTLEYLYKGGRCNAVQNLLGSILKIRPIIKVVNGKMIVGNKVMGDKRKSLDAMLADIRSDKDKLGSNRVIITHSLGSEDEAVYLKNEIQKIVPPDFTILTTPAGCVISSHCGKKTTGIIYQVK